MSNCKGSINSLNLPEDSSLAPLLPLAQQQDSGWKSKASIAKLDFLPPIPKPVGLIFGETGVGKSSLIATLLGIPVPTSNGATGCTSKIECYQNDSMILYDSCGFNESTLGKVTPIQALIEVLQFLTEIKDGINFILMVHKGKITETFKENYRLFRHQIFDATDPKQRIPMILVMNGCETEATGATNWAKNELNIESFTEQKLKFDTIVSTCFAYSGNIEDDKLFYLPKRKLSKLEVLGAIEIFALKKPSKDFLKKSCNFLQLLWNKIVYAFNTNGDFAWISNDLLQSLTRIPGVSEPEAKKLTLLVTNFDDFKTFLNDFC